MGKNRRVLNGLFVISFLFTACTKTAEGTEGPAGAAGQAGLPVGNERSAIYGYVNLISQFNAPFSDFDSVTVSTRMGDSLISTMTDNTGLFRLPGLKSGDYRILFQKKQYDSIAVNVKH